MGEGRHLSEERLPPHPPQNPPPPPPKTFAFWGLGRGEGHTFCPRWAASRPSSNRGWRVVAFLRTAFPPSPPLSFPERFSVPQSNMRNRDSIKSKVLGRRGWGFGGGEDDGMAAPERAVPVDESPRLAGIDSSAGSLSEERFPLPQFFLSTQTRKYGPQNP